MYIESFLTIFGQCINVLNYKSCYMIMARSSPKASFIILKKEEKK